MAIIANKVPVPMFFFLENTRVIKLIDPGDGDSFKAVVEMTVPKTVFDAFCEKIKEQIKGGKNDR